MKISRSIGALILLLVATFGGALANLISQIFMARSMGVEEYGRFSSSLSMIMIITPLAAFGIAQFWLKAYGQEGPVARRWLDVSFRFIALSVIAVAGVIIIWAILGPHNSVTSYIIIILIAHMIGQTAIGLGSSKNQLENNNNRLSIWQVAPHVLRFIGVMIVIFLFSEEQVKAINIAYVYACVGIILVCWAIVELKSLYSESFMPHGHSNLIHTSSCTDSPSSYTLVKNIFPFGLSGLFYIIYYQVDIVLIRYLDSEASSGIYNVAYVVISSLLLFPSVIYQKLLMPSLQRWAYHDIKMLKSVHIKGSVLMLIIGVFAAISMWLLAPLIIPYVFGIEYTASVALVAILLLVVPIRFLGASFDAVLSTKNYISTKVTIMGIGAICNIVLNFLLIPLYSTFGAAVATVITEAIILTAYAVIYFKKYSIN